MNAKDAALLARAKTDVDLAGWFSALGWIADPERDSRRNRVMRSPSGTRVIVTRQVDGHWTFFDTADDRHSGTIFDAAALYAGAVTPGQQYAAIRRALASPPSPVPLVYAARATTGAATGSTPRPLARRLPLNAEGVAYLTSRHLAPTTIQAFSHALYTVEGAGVQAPHNQTGGEERGRVHRHFSGGNAADGQGRGRSAWVAAPLPRERLTQIIVAESYLDALSAWQMLTPAEQRCTAVSSTGGSICPATLLKLTRAVKRLPGVLVLDASDQGEAGTARRTAQLQEATENAGVRYTRHAPPQRHKDWNDALAAQQAHQVARAAILLPPVEEEQSYTL